MSNTKYGWVRHELGVGNIDLLVDTIKIVLCNATYTPSITSNQFLSDIPGGARVATATLTSTVLSSVGIFTAADSVFGVVAGGQVVTQAIIYKDTGVEGTSTLILYLNQGKGLPLTTDGGNLGVSWDTGTFGIFQC